MALFPWQQTAWQRLKQQAQQHSLPHALLFHGKTGMGKRHLADELTRYLLCQQPAELACGECPSCKMLAAGYHPDVKCLEPEGKSETIKVDSIREVNAWVSQSAQYNGYKLVIIDPADAMNMAASNSLLKTLEEPSGKTLFILITTELAQLTPTIRSRCQLVKLNEAEEASAIAWLQQQVSTDLDPKFLLHLANNAPLQALSLADPEKLQQRQSFFKTVLEVIVKQQDPVAAASAWHKAKMAWMLQNLYSLLMDLLKLKLGAQAKDLYNYDLAEALSRKIANIRHSQILALQDKVQQAYQSTLNKVALNSQLVLEDLFIDFYQRLLCKATV